MFGNFPAINGEPDDTETKLGTRGGHWVNRNVIRVWVSWHQYRMEETKARQESRW